jgi:hypothetical protein
MNPFWKVAAKVSPIFRARRVKRFLELFQPARETRILDVGGLPRFWEIPIDAQITILNVGPLEEYELAHVKPNMQVVVGDGTRLDYEDQAFDIVFSNSVIEHLGCEERQVAFAREIQRVGRSYWVQTPAREFPIEAHYFAPFVHWCPKRVQRRLLRNFTLWGLMGRPSMAMVDEAIAELRLLRFREMKQLFPKGDIWIERVLGMPKSYTAYRLSQEAPAMARSRGVGAAATEAA